MRSEGNKPQEVLDLHGLSGRVFDALRVDFAVPAQYPIPLHDVDHVANGAPAVEIAAYAMRYLQIVRHYATPGCAVDTENLVGVLVLLDPVLEELATRSAENRGLLNLARERIYEAAWSIVRDTGGPPSGLFTVR
ncbi:hypothetical protein EV188_1011051 [Actinomycetospora succinea]|uniref:Uncharacterized protein n=1 Tax=Actinomycetospora succinea TaxID=663603 RepID=A0A4R6VPF8_9PSEU|nr:hypothetical protein [Actinomycetospora succinea]TDQ65799.1 hypothetical protein EV188_1011051 [Actinomycetospora succinea]